jgi:hypothetical protein
MMRVTLDDIQTETSQAGTGSTTVRPEDIADVAAPEWGQVPGQALRNALPSAGRFIGGLANVVIHPMQTGQGIGQLMRDVSAEQALPTPIRDLYTKMTGRDFATEFKKATGSDFYDQPALHALRDMLKERYGGEENLRRTLATDPVGVLSDLSTVLGGAGAGFKLASKGSMLAKAGEVAEAASAATNPINLAGKGLGATANMLSKKPDQNMLAAADEARQLGLKIPPSQVSPSLTNVVAEGLGGGKAAVQQGASIGNQPLINRIAARGLGLPETTQLTPELLQNIRRQASKPYEEVRQIGEVTPGEKYFTDLSQLGQKYRGAAKSFPDAAKNEIGDLIDALIVGKFDAGDALDMTKVLRENASKSFRQGDGALGTAQKRAATILEDEIERHLHNLADAPNANPNLMRDFREARKRLAQTYTMEDALSASGNVDVRVLARKLEAGEPLSGELQQLARFGQTFGKAGQLPEKIGARSSGLQHTAATLLAGGGGIAGGVPGIALGAVPYVVPPAARAVVLSGPYQRLVGSSSVSNALAQQLSKRGRSLNYLGQLGRELPPESP